MRRLLVMLLVAAACRHGSDAPLPIFDSLPPPGDPSALAGQWQGELIAGSPLRRALGLGRSVPVTVTITPHSRPDTASPSSTDCRGCFGGTFAADSRGVLNPPRREHRGVEAWLFGGDIAFLRLGGCCDSGELELYGRMERDRLSGRWSQVFLSDGPRGTFELRRAPRSESADPPQN